jgi:hypothetical protein
MAMIKLTVEPATLHNSIDQSTASCSAFATDFRRRQHHDRLLACLSHVAS